MFTPEDAERARGEIEGLRAKDAAGGMNGGKSGEKEGDGQACLNLTVPQLLVIAGFLSGTLEVISVLVDRDQTVQIVLEGSLKRQTQLDKVMEQMGNLSFAQVIKAMMDMA